jgi:uncharacterized protein
MSQPFKLYRLQQLDSQQDRARARLEEIRQALSQHEALRQAEEKTQQSDETLQAARKNLRKAEQLVRDQRIKIEQTESTLYGGKVRNPKELQDLQHESAALKRYLITLEDRQFEAMMAEEEAIQEHATNQAELDNIRIDTARQHKELIEEQNRIDRELLHLEAERSAAAGAIEAGDMTLYEQLRRQRRGLAVALINNKACTACGTTLNAALLDAARSPNQLNRCDNCGRILYFG